MDTYRFDMHVHTSETSACGKVAGADVVHYYKEAGYQGIMITDHYHKEFFNGLGTMDIHQKIETYLSGYHAAKQEGEKLGLDVLLGIEFRNYESIDDFLIVGITEDFLHKNPEIYYLPLKKAIELFHENGMLVIQAHPVRFQIVDQKDGQIFKGYKNYEMLEMIHNNPSIKEVFRDDRNEDDAEYPFMLRVCRLQCENELDGIEVYNGNDGWAQKPEEIQTIVKEHPEYIQISSSDFHKPRHAATGGIILDRRVTDSLELRNALAGGGIIERIQP